MQRVHSQIKAGDQGVLKEVSVCSQEQSHQNKAQVFSVRVGAGRVNGAQSQLSMERTKAQWEWKWTVAIEHRAAFHVSGGRAAQTSIHR